MISIKDTEGYATYGFVSKFFMCDKDGKVGGIRHCREEIALYFSDTATRIGYSNYGYGLNIEKVRWFWKFLEEKIGVKDVIHETQHKDIIVVELDPFWVKNSTRRSFFTMFLRCAVCYTKEADTFDKALAAYPYCTQVSNAIKLFLAGHTYPAFEAKDLGYGIVAKFSGAQEDFVRQNMIKFYPAEPVAK